MPSIKFQAATIQLEALGFLEITEDSNGVRLTDKGRQRAEKIMGDLSMDDKMLLGLFCLDYVKEHPKVFQAIRLLWKGGNHDKDN